MNAAVSPRSWNTISAPLPRRSATLNDPVATPTGTAPTARAHATSCGVSPTTNTSSGSNGIQPARPRSLERERHQRIAIRGIVAKCPAPEVAPQIEVLELDARALRSKLPVSSARNTSGLARSASSNRCDAGHDRLHALARQQDLLAQERHIGVAQPREQILVQLVADAHEAPRAG